MCWIRNGEEACRVGRMALFPGHRDLLYAGAAKSGPGSGKDRARGHGNGCCWLPS